MKLLNQSVRSRKFCESITDEGGDRQARSGVAEGTSVVLKDTPSDKPTEQEALALKAREPVTAEGGQRKPRRFTAGSL